MMSSSWLVSGIQTTYDVYMSLRRLKTSLSLSGSALGRGVQLAPSSRFLTFYTTVDDVSGLCAGLSVAGVKGWLRDAAGSCGPRDAVMVTLFTCCSLFLFDGLQVSGCSQTAGQGTGQWAGQWLQPDSWSVGWSVVAARQLVSGLVSGCSQTDGQGTGQWAGQWLQPDSWSVGWSVGAAKQMVRGLVSGLVSGCSQTAGEVQQETREECFDRWDVH